MTQKELQEVLQELKKANKQRKLWEAREEKLEKLIKDEMTARGVDEIFTEDGNLGATWKEHKTHRFDAKTFGAENPGLYAKYYKEYNQKRFLLKG